MRGDRPVAEPSLVDTHCHIDLYELPACLVTEAEAKQIATIAVTNTPSVFPHTAALTQACRYVHPAVGLHPELVAERARELDLMWPFLEQTRFIGEVGLDYTTPDAAVRQLQRQVFSQILERCAAFGNKVITVHSRRAAADVIAAIGEEYPGRVILHWYSGSLRDLERAIANGLYLSVNPAMYRSEHGQRLIARMPADRVLTETDGPFVRMGDRPARPLDVASVVQTLATHWSLDYEGSRSRLRDNYWHLLG